MRLELVILAAALLLWDFGRRYLAREQAAALKAEDAAAKAEEAKRAAQDALKAAGQLVQSALERVTQLDHRVESLELVDQLGAQEYRERRGSTGSTG